MSQRWGYLSPIPPAGLAASVVKACYQFDGPTSGLTDRSGNGHTLAFSGTKWGWMPMKAEFGCNFLGLLEDTFAKSAASAALGTLGVATMEFVIIRQLLGSMDDTYNVYVGVGADDDASEAGNIIFSVAGTSTYNRWGIFFETGTGVNQDVFSTEWGIGLTGGCSYIAVTRASDGKTYKLYMDGKYIETIVASLAPTGGTLVPITVGGFTAGTDVACAFNSVRWSHAEFSANQIRETYLDLRT